MGLAAMEKCTEDTRDKGAAEGGDAPAAGSAINIREERWLLFMGKRKLREGEMI